MQDSEPGTQVTGQPLKKEPAAAPTCVRTSDGALNYWKSSNPGSHVTNSGIKIQTATTPSITAK